MALVCSSVVVSNKTELELSHARTHTHTIPLGNTMFLSPLTPLLPLPPSLLLRIYCISSPACFLSFFVVVLSLSRFCFLLSALSIVWFYVCGLCLLSCSSFNLLLIVSKIQIHASNIHTRTHTKLRLPYVSDVVGKMMMVMVMVHRQRNGIKYAYGMRVYLCVCARAPQYNGLKPM